MEADIKDRAIISDAELADMAARAATLEERRTISGDPADDEDTRKLAGDQLDWWRRCAAGGNPQHFAQRLRDDDLSATDVARMTGGVPDWKGELPAWAGALSWVMAALCASDDAVPGEEAARQPFAHAFVGLARAILARAGFGAADGFEPSARDDLAGALVTRLTAIAIPSLFTNFATLRKLLETGQIEHDGSDLYEAYVAALRDGGFRRLFLDHPVLARLIAHEALRATEEMREARERLAADAEALAGFLGGAPGPVAAIRTGLSDPHNGGRRVMIYSFANGMRIVYKPRPLDIDRAWAACIDLMNERGAPIDLKAPHLLARDGYGWVSFVEHLPCTGMDEVVSFYRRSGALLALIHLLRGRDFHLENVIASGAWPIAVDVETMCHPGPMKRPLNQLLAAVEHRIDQSVMVTHYLTIRGGPQNNVPMGGLDLPKEVNINLWRFEQVNTGRMTRSTKPMDPVSANNLPLLDGKPVGAADHADTVADGYAETLRFLLAQPEMQAGAYGIPLIMEAVPVRWLPEATASYMNIISGLRHPDLLGDGARWSAAAESLAATRLSMGLNEATLAREEQRALIDQDVPLFRVAAGTDRVFGADGRPLPDVQAPPVTPLDIAVEGGDRERFIRVEASVIRSALGFAKPHFESVGPSSDERGLAAPAAEAEAQRLAHVVMDLALRAGDQTAWVGIVLKESGDALDVGDLRYNLYEGAAGIAVFLAAVARVCDDAQAAATARAALNRLGERYRLIGPRAFYDQLGIGGAAGLPSVAYGMDVAGSLLDEPAWRALAVAIASELPDEAIAADRQHDIIGGAAGAICVLLKLQQSSGDPRLLQRAIACGEGLLAKRDENGLWPFAGGPPLTGLSHGAAGFAYALGQLAAATGRQDFHDAAQACIDYERKHFDRDQANWPDLREFEGETVRAHFAHQWCHGSAGVGLSRLGLGLLGSFQGVDLERDIALRTTAEHLPGHVDDVCCGAFGRFMVLDSVATRLDRPEIAATAMRWARQLMDRAHATGSYRINLASEEMNPGFFKGISGIGYGLLRLAGHHELPDIISFA